MIEYSTDYEYVEQKKGIRLLWSPHLSWRSYTLTGDVIECLSGKDVRDWLEEPGYNWKIANA